MTRPNALGANLARTLAATFAVLAVSVAIVHVAAGASPAPSGFPSVPPAVSAAPSADLTAAPTEAPSSGAATPAATPSLSVPVASDEPTPAPSFLNTLPPAPTPIAHPSNGQSNTCFDCHSSVNNQQKGIAAQWKASVHGQNGVGCADCHGGDPTTDSITAAMSTSAGFIGIPTKAQAVGICGGCHSDAARMSQYQLATDEYAKYATSIHGELLANGDARVATCQDCHGSHDILKASDPKSPVYPFNVPALCASCHANADLMKPYGIATDQYELYKASVHGQALLTNQDLRAPTCASCHGSHDAKPPQNSNIVDVCGKCHTATQALYEQSTHASLTVGPKCTTCHGTHDVANPSEARFFHPTATDVQCTTCHEAPSMALRPDFAQFAVDADRRCDSCHHSNSLEYSQAKGIHDALVAASTAYDDATAKLAEAASTGMIVTDADVLLTQARTSLIQARANVHTTKLTVVAQLADDAIAKAGQASSFAEARLDESIFRREAMVVVVALILLNVLALALVRRRLHRRPRLVPSGGIDAAPTDIPG